MGAFSSHTSSIDGVNSLAPVKASKSKRLREKFRSRQSSRVDLLSTNIDAIDPNWFAQNPQAEGENYDRDKALSADTGKL